MSSKIGTLILDALGLEGRNVTRLELVIEASKLPRLTVHMLPFLSDPTAADRFAKTVAEFDLVERPKPPKADSE